MVLSLKPNHFLARVFRGRIYVKEGQYSLASEDYLEANRTSQYRFIHYDLYQEYFKSVNNEFRGKGETVLKKIDDVFRLSDCAVLMTPWDNYKKITSRQIKKLKIMGVWAKRQKLGVKNANHQ